MNSIITDWTNRHADLVDRGIVLGHHNILDSVSFDDASLISIIDAQPRSNVRVNITRPYDGTPEWRDGDIGELSGAEILETIRNGSRLWLNLINPSEADPVFREMTANIYDEFERRCPSFRTRSRSENLLISSPDALVNYHVDPGPTMLWHFRGRKRVWVYPWHDQEFLAQDDLEKVCTQEWEGWEIPYRPELDERAKVFDLEPGQFIYWPQHSPHRVENLGEINVSLTSNHSTNQSVVCNAVYRANRFFRSRLGLPLRSTRTTGVAAMCKVAAIMAARLTGAYTTPRYEPVISFQLDPASPTGYVDVPGPG